MKNPCFTCGHERKAHTREKKASERTLQGKPKRPATDAGCLHRCSCRRYVPTRTRPVVRFVTQYARQNF